ncbi:MAG: T9SS type A sorting domain-containing protein [Flavobacterium sp.]|nr:T9SS type A sorting domain-containing protein [Flavobacterium sp.]
MKGKLLLMVLLPFLSIAQVQIGQDIDGEAEFDTSGWSQSISSDGSTLAIGARLNNGVNGASSGHVRVYENIGGVWSQKGQDIDGEAANDRSGFCTSISGNGSIVAVGAPLNDGNNNDSGQVRVFEFVSNSWIQKGQDIDGEFDGDNFGHSVSLSNDGLKLAVGAILNDGNGSNSGHVRVFEFITGNWVQVGQDINGISAGDNFGYSVSISDDGTFVAVGSPFNDVNGDSSGQVRVFQNVSNNWIQVGQSLNGGFNMFGDLSGYSVSLSSSGTILAIGSPYNDNTGNNTGNVKVFQNQGGIWTQLGQDINGATNDVFSGTSVSLSSNGNVVAIGAEFSNGSAPNSGRTRVFKYIGNTWLQAGIDMNGEATNDASGKSVSISSDGSKVAIGAYNNDGNGTDSGHVRVYNLSAVLNTENFDQNSFSVYPNPVRSILHIDNALDLNEVEIYSITGKKVKSITNNLSEIDVNELESGIYFVKLYANSGITTKKVIKE